MDDFFDTLKSKRDRRAIIERISSIPSNYVGSKRRLLPYIVDALDSEGIVFDSAFDAFSGSAMVSLLFKMMGKKVYCNDLLTSSSITAVCLLELDDIPLTTEDLRFLCKTIQKIREHLSWIITGINFSQKKNAIFWIGIRKMLRSFVVKSFIAAWNF